MFSCLGVYNLSYRACVTRFVARLIIWVLGKIYERYMQRAVA